MEDLGKGLGTVGIWGGVTAAVVLSGDAAIPVSIVGFICAVLATIAIW